MSKNNNQTDTMYTDFLPLVQPMAKKNGQQLPVDENVTLPYIPTVIDTVPDLQTQFLSSGGKRVTGQNVRDIYYTMSSPVAYWSRGGVTPWSQKVVDYGGYAKYAQIWSVENDLVIHWISNVDNNITKPTLTNHGNWRFIESIYFIQNTGGVELSVDHFASQTGSINRLNADEYIKSNKFIDLSFPGQFNIGLQDNPLSSGLALIYHGGGGVTLYGRLLTNGNGFHKELGVELNLDTYYSLEVSPDAPTTDYSFYLSVLNSKTSLTIVSGNPTVRSWNITIHAKLLS